MKCSIIGGSGYTGQEMVRLLSAHPEAEIAHIGSRSYAGIPFWRLFESSTVDICFEDISLAEAAEDSDIVFLALPHGIASKEVNRELLKKCIIIDLSADFRLKDPELYQEWYPFTHSSPSLLSESVYGLPEWHREEIKTARLIGNPGCYTSASILGAAPALYKNLVDPNSIMIDGKSGASGAGRAMKSENLFCEIMGSIRSYKVGTHRHTPEIEEQLSIISGSYPKLIFTPHVVPMDRGLQATIFLKVKPGVTYEQCREAYLEAYKDEPFIRVLEPNIFPQTRWVRGTNYCHISLTLDQRTDTLVVITSIDNLIKGSAGTAVQNMNIVCGLPEEMGLQQAALLP